MSKDTLYFKHDCTARADRKLINIIMKHGMEGIGVYWCIVEMLYEEGGYLPLEYERITFELRAEINVIRSVINDFDLFKNDGEKFWSCAVLERLQWRCEKSEKARNSINKRWEKERDTNVIQSNEVRNTKKKRKEKEKEKEIKEKNKHMDCVFLSNEEEQKLKLQLINGDFEKAIEVLNNYKMQSGKKYKSDYHAIMNWVIERISTGKPHKKEACEL